MLQIHRGGEVFDAFMSLLTGASEATWQVARGVVTGKCDRLSTKIGVKVCCDVHSRFLDSENKWCAEVTCRVNNFPTRRTCRSTCVKKREAEGRAFLNALSWLEQQDAAFWQMELCRVGVAGSDDTKPMHDDNKGIVCSSGVVAPKPYRNRVQELCEVNAFKLSWSREASDTAFVSEVTIPGTYLSGHGEGRCTKTSDASACEAILPDLLQYVDSLRSFPSTCVGALQQLQDIVDADKHDER